MKHYSRSRKLLGGIVLCLALLIIWQARPTALIAKVTITTAQKKIPLQLETALNQRSRAHGLMGRTNVGEYDGMLFLFPRPSIQHFWMKNTRIPLDIVFIDANKRISAIVHGVPESLAKVGPDQPIMAVIELAAGRATREGMRVGDGVDYDNAELLQTAVR